MDNKTTPPSGMPAAVAATSIAKPSLAIDEIRANRDDPNGKLLAAIEEVRDEARERDKRIDGRFAALESELATVVNRTNDNTKSIGEQADALTKIAGAAATAANMALEAKQAVARQPDDTSKLVESALRIHASSIAAVVDDAVRKAVQPLEKTVGELENREEERERELRKSNEAMGAIVNELGIEDTVELGRKVEPGEQPPERALKKINQQVESFDRRAKSSTIVQLVIALGVIASLVQQLLSHH